MTSGLPIRLPAPAATWERDVDVVIVGSGAAGLATALATRPSRSVMVVTKDRVASRFGGVGTRSCHRRTDHQSPQDSWCAHLDVRLSADAWLTIDNDTAPECRYQQST